MDALRNFEWGEILIDETRILIILGDKGLKGKLTGEEKVSEFQFCKDIH